MKKCTYCGKEYTDEVTECMIDGQPLASFPPEPKPAGNDSRDEIKSAVIRVFGSREAATLAATKLEAHGIECWVNADDCGGMMSVIAGGGVKLFVCSDDAEAATAILDSQLQAASPASENTEGMESGALVRDRPKLVIVWGIWMIYGTGLIINILVLYAALSGTFVGMQELIYFWLSIGCSTLCIYMLFRAIKNYIIHKKRAAKEADAQKNQRIL